MLLRQPRVQLQPGQAAAAHQLREVGLEGGIGALQARDHHQAGVELGGEVQQDIVMLINEYGEALQRFTDKGFYQIEDQIERELDCHAGIRKKDPELG